MSGYYAVAFQDRIEIVSDGAHFGRDGVLTAIERKVSRSFLLPVAVTGVGVAADLAEMKLKVMEATELASVDAALAQLRHTLHDAPKHVDQESVILVAAMSERMGPQLFTWSNVDRILLNRGRSHAFGPGLSTDELLALGVDFKHPDGLREDGVAILGAMRSKASAPFGMMEGHYVGGQVDWTVVDAAGARGETVHRWPDTVGKLIQPA